MEKGKDLDIQGTIFVFGPCSSKTFWHRKNLSIFVCNFLPSLTLVLPRLSHSFIPQRGPDCKLPLGMENSQLPNASIVSWSPILGKFLIASARMNGQFAWCSAEELGENNGPFLQITLSTPHTISALSTMSFHSSWASHLLLKYKSGDSFILYKEGQDHDGVRVAVILILAQSRMLDPILNTWQSCLLTSKLHFRPYISFHAVKIWAPYYYWRQLI